MKVLNDMNDIVMGIHHIMDEDDEDLDSLIQEYAMVDKEDSVVESHEIISKKTYLEFLDESFNISVDEEKLSGSLVELLITYGKLYEKSVKTERQLLENEEKLESTKKKYEKERKRKERRERKLLENEEELESTKEKYEELVQNKQAADEEIEKMRKRLSDLEAAFEDKEMEIILLKVDIADTHNSRKLEEEEDTLSSSNHLVGADEKREESNETHEKREEGNEAQNKNETKQLDMFPLDQPEKERILHEQPEDKIEAGLNETTVSILPIPLNIDTPRINTAVMQGERMEVESDEGLILEQLRRVRQVRHDEYLKGKMKTMEEGCDGRISSPHSDMNSLPTTNYQLPLQSPQQEHHGLVECDNYT